jgi:hypothetical protein
MGVVRDRHCCDCVHSFPDHHYMTFNGQRRRVSKFRCRLQPLRFGQGLCCRAGKRQGLPQVPQERNRQCLR